MLQSIPTLESGVCSMAALPGGRLATGHVCGEVLLWHLGCDEGQNPAGGMLKGHLSVVRCCPGLIIPSLSALLI